jgi:hypothetical protein
MQKIKTHINKIKIVYKNLKIYPMVLIKNKDEMFYFIHEDNKIEEYRTL